MTEPILTEDQKKTEAAILNKLSLGYTPKQLLQLAGAYREFMAACSIRNAMFNPIYHYSSRSTNPVEE